MCRYQQDVDADVGGIADFEKVIAKLKEINQNYHDKSKLYDMFYEQYQSAVQEILLKRQALDSFNAAIQMFDEQVGSGGYSSNRNSRNGLPCLYKNEINIFHPIINN